MGRVTGTQQRVSHPQLRPAQIRAQRRGAKSTMVCREENQQSRIHHLKQVLTVQRLTAACVYCRRSVSSRLGQDTGGRLRACAYGEIVWHELI